MGFSALVCNAPQHLLFSADKVGVGFRQQKGVWQPLAASQTLCLPHPWVGKIALLNLLLVTATGAPPHGREMRQFIFPAFSFVPRFRAKRAGSLVPQHLPQLVHTGLNLLGGAGTLPLPQSGHTAAHRRSRGGFLLLQEFCRPLAFCGQFQFHQLPPVKCVHCLPDGQDGVPRLDRSSRT